MRSKNKAKHLFSLSCGSKKIEDDAETERKGEMWEGGGEEGEREREREILRAGCPAVSDSGFAFGAKILLKICSRYSTRAVPAADDSRGMEQGEGEAEQRETEQRQSRGRAVAAAAAAQIGAKFKDASMKKRPATAATSTATSTSALAAAPA